VPKSKRPKLDKLMTNAWRALPLEWHALYTRHQHEKVVADSLAGSGIEVFLPTYSVLRQWKDRRKQLSLPLFPCYVFLRASFEHRIKILSTPGTPISPLGGLGPSQVWRPRWSGRNSRPQKKLVLADSLHELTWEIHCS
jgi:Transcription termination factor nusG